MRVLLLLSVCFCLTMSLKSSHSSDKILGLWKLTSSTGKTKFYKYKGKYYGKIIYDAKYLKKDGKTSIKDTKNPNPKLRGREVVGITCIRSLKYEDGKYSGGYVYDPGTGKTYNCKMWFEGKKLMFRGYKGISIFGKTLEYRKL